MLLSIPNSGFNIHNQSIAMATPGHIEGKKKSVLKTDSPLILRLSAIASPRDAIMQSGIENIRNTVFQRYCQNFGSFAIILPDSEWNPRRSMKLCMPTNFGGHVMISHL